MMKTIFTTVFSDGPGGGNPAPVFVEADSMTEEEMQKAAADLGQESVFVRKPVCPDCDLMLQYFVPDHELTICAHDTIGAITALKEEGRIEKEHLLVETKAGPVQVDWEEDEKGVLVMMEQFLPEFNDGVPAADDVAAALRIPASDLGASEKMPLENVSTSRYKLMVPVRSRDILDGLTPDYEALWKLCDSCGASGFYVVAQDPVRKDVFYARQFPCRSGYLEDPATGIAATALGAYVVVHSLMPVVDGWNRVSVYQGHAMGRPSLILADILLESGQITGIRVCGYAERTKQEAALA